MEQQQKEKPRGVVMVSNVVIGLSIAALYIILTLLIPSQVRQAKNGLTNARMYPYFVFVCAAVMAVAFTLAFRKERYALDLGIWPMILASVMLYLGTLTLGFYSSASLVIAYMMLVWKVRSWWQILLTAVLTPALIYATFTLGMNIHLPTGVLI